MEKKIVTILEKICGALLVGMVLLLFAQVGTRYILRGSLLWAGEMAVWLFVWVSYLGAVVLFINKKHIIVDLVSNMLPEKVARILNGINDLIVLAFLTIIFYHSIPVVISYSRQTATSISVSKFFLFSSLTVSFFLMIVYSIYSIFRMVRGR